MPPTPCAICGLPTYGVKNDTERQVRRYPCPQCAPFDLSVEAGDAIHQTAKGPTERAVLSFAVRRIPRKGREVPLITGGLVRSLVETTKLPDALEQLDNLVVWFGETTQTGEYVNVDERFQAVVGAARREGVEWATRNLLDVGLLLRGDRQLHEDIRDESGKAVGGVPFFGYALSAKGWERFRELKRSALGSRKAFMAMPFRAEPPELQAMLDEMYEKHFRRAVAATGFALRRLDEDAPAGLIDDRLRVEILTSRFLIAELTTDNRGVYWEAGFAEGAGRPVIYTVREGYDSEVHFDTNHRLFVPWDPDDPEPAVKKLKDTIRATLPAEAKLDDE